MSEDNPSESIVGGRYRLDEPLDSGGLSTVWRATDLERRGPVAVKCEHDGIHDPEQVKKHFRRELRWFRRFTDGPTPGSLVQFVDGSTEDGDQFVVTELIEGGSLESAFDGGGQSGMDAIDALAGPICRTVAFLHVNGVAHLDLKPANVLERPHGPPAVIDLNSAVSASEGTDTLFHHDPFKPPELSPTDACAEPTGRWSDVYALGMLLFFLLTGELSNQSDEAVADWSPVDPWTRGVECPAELATAIRTATEPRRDDRYADAVELSDAIAPVLSGVKHVATLTDETTGIRIPVRPGDTLGRFAQDRAIPAIVLPDDEQFLSPSHARINRTRGGWVLVDRSLNGTFVERAGDWQYVCSQEGVERRESAGQSVPLESTSERLPLDDGARIAPVSPEYGRVLTFTSAGPKPVPDTTAK